MKEILRAIRDRGLSSKGDIANKMGIQESTLDSILSLLSSKGYLETIDSTAEIQEACTRCSVNKECMQEAYAGSVYIVTKKGKNYLEKILPDNSVGSWRDR